MSSTRTVRRDPNLSARVPSAELRCNSIRPSKRGGPACGGAAGHPWQAGIASCAPGGRACQPCSRRALHVGPARPPGVGVRETHVLAGGP